MLKHVSSIRFRCSSIPPHARQPPRTTPPPPARGTPAPDQQTQKPHKPASHISTLAGAQGDGQGVGDAGERSGEAVGLVSARREGATRTATVVCALYRALSTVVRQTEQLAVFGVRLPAFRTRGSALCEQAPGNPGAPSNPQTPQAKFNALSRHWPSGYAECTPEWNSSGDCAS